MSAQADAMVRACEILGEHFEGFIVVAEVEQDDKSTAVRMELGGGIHRALGLAVRAQDILLHEPPGEDWKNHEDEP